MSPEAQPTEFELLEPGSSRETLDSFLGALLPLLSDLSPEDRELVLDLARRLARGSGGDA